MDHNGVWYLGLQLKTNKDKKLPLALEIKTKPSEESKRSKMLLSFEIRKKKVSSMLKKYYSFPLHYRIGVLWSKPTSSVPTVFFSKEDLQYLKTSPHKDHEGKQKRNIVFFCYYYETQSGFCAIYRLPKYIFCQYKKNYDYVQL